VNSVLPRLCQAAALFCFLTGCSSPALLYEGKGDLSHAPLNARIIRLSEEGVGPTSPVPLPEHIGGVAFLNDTRDRVLSIRFPDHVLGPLRCSFTTGFSAGADSTFSSEPLAPGAIVTICFHVLGPIEYEVYGLLEEPQRGVVVVGETP
jgi:hypothetical protein